MLRTRDLVIFVVILVILIAGIALTFFKDAATGKADIFEGRGTSLETTDEFLVEGAADEFDREGIISRLRKSLALDDSDVKPEPSVEAPVAEEQKDDADTDTDTNTGSVERCGTFDDAESLARTWPLSDITFTIASGVRQVVHTQTSNAAVDTKATTTATSTALLTPLIHLPLAPLVSGEYCLPSEVIGITVTGSLMYNTEADFYKGYGPEYLIGYARDGFPIYGHYDGLVDQCGGYAHPLGYRYSVSTQRDYLLGCYSSVPASFIIQ